MSNATTDPIALIEAAYRPQLDSTAWMHAMTPLVTDTLDRDQMGAYSFLLTEEGPRDAHFVQRARSRHDAGWFLRNLFEVHDSVPDADRSKIRAQFRTPGLFSLSQTLGYVPDALIKETLGYRDCLAVVVHALEGPPSVFVTLRGRTSEVDRSARSLWRRLAAHLGAACRLSGRVASADAEDVECVLTSDGSAVDARGAAVSAGAREHLRRAVRAVDRARTRGVRAEPLQALDLWRGLFVGRWSLVDHFDTDGRRFILARRNDPRAKGRSELSLRQRQILFYVSAGWSNKEVAYALGLGEATVATHLRRALDAIGLRSRLEWIRLAANVEAAAMQAATRGESAQRLGTDG